MNGESTAMLQSLDNWLNRYWQRIRSREIAYWVIALVFLAAAAALDWHFEDQPDLLSVRYWLFRQLPQPGLRALRPGFTKVALIEDDQYWHPPLVGRYPLKRDYIASLVDALDKADAKVIALDFDFALKAPKSDGGPRRYGEIPEEFRPETIVLIKAIEKAAENRPVVLPKRVRYGITYDYVTIPDLLGPFGICTKVDRDGNWSNPGTQEFHITPNAQRNISCGYINLPKDMRTLPPKLLIGDGIYLDSFALAIAKQINREAVAHIKAGSYYGSYIDPETMAEYHMTVSVGDLLANDPETIRRLQREPIIVGGGWRVDGGVGEYVDSHYTPIGATLGALVHANFTEALLDGRNYTYVSRITLHILDILFGLLVIVVLAGLSRFIDKVLALIVLSIVLFGIEAIMLVSLGTFFDAFMPLLSVWVHSSLERFFREWFREGA